MQKITNIVPIAFVGGTGGYFLAYLINSANRQFNDKIQLSEHGNAHYSGLGLDIPSHGVGDDPAKVIQSVINARKDMQDNALTCYCSCHITDLELATEWFYKTIRITYTEADIETISLIFVGKNVIDSLHLPINTAKIVRQTNWLIKYQTQFSPLTKLNDRVLDISWDELYNGDELQLVQKISKFTNIPASQFTLTNLAEWRARTKQCVLKVTQLLN